MEIRGDSYFRGTICMKIDIDHTEINFLLDILQEKIDMYRENILSGYTDTDTPLSSLNDLESKQKQIVKLYDKLNQR